MRAIRNISGLCSILQNEREDWQNVVYEKTGVIVNATEAYVALVSACGVIDLDADAEYEYVCGQDVSEYCDINTISELVDYILSMDSYHEYLLDAPLGRFKKSELYWAIRAQIIEANENTRREDGTVVEDWGIYKIGGDTTNIIIKMAFTASDSCEVCLRTNSETNLAECLEMIVEQLNLISCDDPVYKVWNNHIVNVPRTYGELKYAMGI